MTTPEAICLFGFLLLFAAAAAVVISSLLGKVRRLETALSLARMELLETRKRFVACHQENLRMKKGERL